MNGKEKIGIFGSAAGAPAIAIAQARALGEALTEHDVVLITGACSGIPYEVVHSAYQKNRQIEVWGFSPARNLEEHTREYPHDDHTIYRRLEYIPQEFSIEDITVRRKYRNVFSTATCDAGIIVSGRWGTMNEFTNLFDMGKIIGVLTETGGVADRLGEWSKEISKPSKAVVVYEHDPQKLVERVLEEIDHRRTL